MEEEKKPADGTVVVQDEDAKPEISLEEAKAKTLGLAVSKGIGLSWLRPLYSCIHLHFTVFASYTPVLG